MHTVMILKIWTPLTVTVTVLKWDSVVFNAVVRTTNVDGMTNGIVQWVCPICPVQSTLVISKSEGPSKTLRDIRISTYLICSIEKKKTI